MLEDYFGRMDWAEAPKDYVVANAVELLRRVNLLLSGIDLPEAQQPTVVSGWRPESYNATVPGASLRSKHITGNAIDLSDPEGALDEYLFSHSNRLSEAGVYLEHPLATKGWTHLQSIPPRSGNVIFMP